MEMSFFIQRGYTHLIMGGVFERFPKLRYILTESGCAWAPRLMQQMDAMYMAWKAGYIGEIDTSKDPALKEPPSFYARRNCWYGASFPSVADINGRDAVGVDRVLWGNDYPHYEGCYPYSRENMRFAFSDIDEKEVRMMLGENAAKLYNFDLAALKALGAGSQHQAAGCGRAADRNSRRLHLYYFSAGPCQRNDGHKIGQGDLLGHFPEGDSTGRSTTTSQQGTPAHLITCASPLPILSPRRYRAPRTADAVRGVPRKTNTPCRARSSPPTPAG